MASPNSSESSPQTDMTSPPFVERRGPNDADLARFVLGQSLGLTLILLLVHICGATVVSQPMWLLAPFAGGLLVSLILGIFHLGVAGITRIERIKADASIYIAQIEQHALLSGENPNPRTEPEPPKPRLIKEGSDKSK